MTWSRLVGLLALVALLPATVGALVLDTSSDLQFPDVAAVADRLITSGITLGIAVIAVSVLRWWPEVRHERLRARPWVWAVPVLLLATALALLDFRRVGEAGWLVVVALVLVVASIAVGEELLFRGVVLIFLRSRTGELGAALGSSVFFGLMHFPAGPVQVVASALFGYLLYLTRRVSGGIGVSILVHAAWDFSVFTAFLTDTPAAGSDASVALTLLTLGLSLITLLGWSWWQPRPTPAPASPPGG